tara:strand:- start:9 stop:722 length:714 start_codon:yes stop_codon:yes gene_type:complete
MFQPIPEPSATSGFLRIKQDEKHRIRIMGTSKEPSSFIQGWEAWGQDNKPVRAPYELGKPCPQSLREIDRDGKPKLFWMFIVWHVDLDKPMVLSVTQQTIKNQILSYSNNPKWGDPSNYVLEIGRTGTGMETIYTVIAEPPIEVPSSLVLDDIDAARIDVRVVFEDGNPFGALAEVDDQANVQQLQSSSKQVAPEPAPNLEMPSNSVGNVALDAISSLKAAKDKSAAAKPVTDDIPY